jgi:hypothetical protein
MHRSRKLRGTVMRGVRRLSQNTMQDLVQQIRAANAAGLYYVALFSSLALPDICGALESLDGLAKRARYVDWFDRWLAPIYGGNLDGDTCYQFRCSILHQGRTQHPRGPYSRIFFVEPGAGSFVLHNNVFNDALNIDVRIFCEDLGASVERWLPTVEHLPHFQANLANFVTRYPNGLAPYVVGPPVIG